MGPESILLVDGGSGIIALLVFVVFNVLCVALVLLGEDAVVLSVATTVTTIMALAVAGGGPWFVALA